MSAATAPFASNVASTVFATSMRWLSNPIPSLSKYTTYLIFETARRKLIVFCHYRQQPLPLRCVFEQYGVLLLQSEIDRANGIVYLDTGEDRHTHKNVVGSFIGQNRGHMLPHYLIADF